MFKSLSDKISSNFDTLVSTGRQLFVLDIDREVIWEKYLSGFNDPIVRQSYNCSNCRAFITKYAAMVVLDDSFDIRHMFENIDSVIALDDELLSDGMSTAMANVVSYLKTRPLSTIALYQFDEKEVMGGTVNNIGALSGVRWHHFAVNIPSNLIVRAVGTSSAASIKSKFDSKVTVLSRCLKEFKIDDTELVLELINQGSLYRGDEFKEMLEAFLKVQKEYSKLKINHQNYLFLAGTKLPHAIAGIRNTAIGTLLEDVATGLDLDDAVNKFEKIMAPANYKRTTAIATPAMIAKAKEELDQLGLSSSLNRRFATIGDINVSDVLFAYTPTASVVTDVFDELATSQVVNPRSLSKIEDISVEDFIEKVLPTVTKVQALVESRHKSNLVSLITAQDLESARLFKWGNPFSWSYSGGVTDAIKERVKEAGGSVEGVLRVSLSWSNGDDLDLHLREPSGDKIYYSSYTSDINSYSSNGGQLDVDMNAGGRYDATNPVENIIYPNASKLQKGKYEVTVDNYQRRSTANIGYTVQVEFDGQIFEFRSTNNNRKEKMVVIDYDPQKGFSVEGAEGTLKGITSESVWGIETFKLTDITTVMLSPNFWGDQEKGNKHYIFGLKDCISDESPRPFYNEFLRDELTVHRKTMEMVSGKLKIAEDPSQISGVGFSSTLRNDMIVKVVGKFERYLRIKF